MNKKGETIDSLYPVVLTIILVGIILGIGIYVLGQTSNAVSTETLTVLNETITGLATAGDSFATISDCGAHDFTKISVTNATSGVTVPTSNYTFSSLGWIYGVGSGGYVGQNVNVSYSYTGTTNTASTGPCGSMSTTSTGLGGLASWIAVIVVVLAAAIVLGIVISSFGKGNAI